MKSFDTNVAVRLIVVDDVEQCERAARAFRRAVADGGAFFSATVMIEVAWVLRVAYKQDRAAITAALRRFVGTVGVTVEHDAIVRRAIDAFETGCQWPRRTDPLWPSETDPPRVRFRGRSPRERGHLLTHPWPSGLTHPRRPRVVVGHRAHRPAPSSVLLASGARATRSPGPRVTSTSACWASRSSSAAVSLSSPKTRLHSPKERLDVRIVARRS